MQKRKPKNSRAYYTVLVQRANGDGETIIESFKAATIEDAKEQALDSAAEDLSEDTGSTVCPDDLMVIGVARGIVIFDEWNDRR